MTRRRKSGLRTLSYFLITILFSVMGSSLVINSESVRAEENTQCFTHLTNESIDEIQQDWSPDGTQIVFMKAEYTTSSSGYPNNIWVMDEDGSNHHTLTHSTSWDCNRQPKWSYDGTKITFWAFRPFGEGGSIWVMNADGTHQVKIHVRSGYDASKPAFSPDGTKIVFTSCIRYDGGPNELYMMNADGSNVVKILNALDGKNDGRGKAGGSVSFSPDGQWIAFESERSGNWDIWLVRPDGSDLTQITRDINDDYYPAWSPDGKQITFSSNRSGNDDIWILTNVEAVINGGMPVCVQLTDNSGLDKYSAWSPDGTKIAFSSRRSGTWDIWVVDVNCCLDFTGPVTSNLSVKLRPPKCPISLRLKATVDDSATGNSNIKAIEYFLDIVGEDGTGIPLSSQDGSFDSPIEDVNTHIDVKGLSPGLHTLWVHGQDAVGTWGAFNYTTFSLTCSSTAETPPETMNEQMRPLAQYNMAKSEELSIQVQELLSQARAKGIDTTECEILIKEAEEWLMTSQEYFRSSNYIAANMYALKAIEAYEDAIELLLDLLN